MECYGADLHAENDYACRMASKNGHIEVLKYLIEHEADSHAADENALSLAAKNNQLDVVEYLLTACAADVHANQESALQMAFEGGHLKMVQLLVKYGSKLSTEDCQVAMNTAIQQTNLPVLQYLVEQYNAKIAVGDWAYLTIIRSAHLSIKRLWRRHYTAHVDAEDGESLHRASLFGRRKLVELLLEHGADPHANDDFAVRTAAENGDLVLVQLLVDRYRADFRALDDAAINWAYSAGHWPVVKYLREKGGKLHSKGG